MTNWFKKQQNGQLPKEFYEKYNFGVVPEKLTQRQIQDREMYGKIHGQRDIIISANNNEEIVTLPIVPEVSVTSPQENERFKTADKGYMNLIGDLGLREFTIDSIFPNKGAYLSLRPGSVAEPFLYVNFINKWRIEKVPFRVVASRPDGRVWFNIPMLVDSFEYELLKGGSIDYSLSLSEYPFYQELIK